jgi:DNA-binding LytR/AlgR family response regulator
LHTFANHTSRHTDQNLQKSAILPSLKNTQDMIIYTNSEKIIRLRKPLLNISLFKDEQDLSTKIKTSHFPLLVLTSDFKDLHKFAVSYFKREPLYELIVINEKSQNKTLRFLNNDILAILTDPFLQTDFDLVMERYKFRRDLFQDKNYSQILLKVNTSKYILISEIKFIRAYGNYTLVFTSKERIMERTLFSEITNRLPKDIFIQTHRSFVVNINCITEIKQRSLKIGNDTIPISSRKKSEVIQLLENQNMIV